MAKKKNFWYVLVITNYGPVFVTKVNNTNKTAEWNSLEKPLELDAFWAKDLALGLNLNFNLAYPVCYPIEIDTQPYNYKDFDIKFEEKGKDLEMEETENV